MAGSSKSKKKRSLARRRGRRGRKAPLPVRLNEAAAATVEALSERPDLAERVFQALCVHLELPYVGLTPMFTRDVCEVAQWWLGDAQCLDQLLLAAIDGPEVVELLAEREARPVDPPANAAPTHARLHVAWVRMDDGGDVPVLRPEGTPTRPTIDHLADPLPDEIPVAAVDFESLDLRMLVAAVRYEPVIAWLDTVVDDATLRTRETLRSFVVALLADAWLALQMDDVDERVAFIEAGPTVDELVAEMDYRPAYLRAWDDEHGPGSWVRHAAAITRDASRALESSSDGNTESQAGDSGPNLAGPNLAGPNLLLDLARAEKQSDLSEVRAAIEEATPAEHADAFPVEAIADALGFDIDGWVEYVEDAALARMPLTMLELPPDHPLVDAPNVAQALVRRADLPVIERARFDEIWAPVKAHGRWVDLARFLASHPVQWVSGASFYEFVRRGALELARLDAEPLPTTVMGADRVSLGATWGELPSAASLVADGLGDDEVRTVATGLVATLEAGRGAG